MSREIGDLRLRAANRLITGEEYLDIGVVGGGEIGVPDARHLRQARARERPRLIVQVLVNVGPVEGRVKFLGQRVVEAERLVIVKILADPRRIDHHGDSHGSKVLLGPYARQHEQLGRVYRAGGQDHLPFREHDPLPPVLNRNGMSRISERVSRFDRLTTNTSTPVALLLSVLTLVTVAFTIT